MNYQTSNFGSFSNAAYSSSLSVVPTLSSAPKKASFKVCVTYRNRDNTKYIDIWDDNTLEDLKWKICKQFDLKMKPTDFSLIVFDEVKEVWIPIHDENIHNTIVNLKLPFLAFLNVEKREEINTNQQHRSTLRESELKLRLCKQPMDKSDYTYLTTNPSTTLGQLKEQAQVQVTNQRTDHLSLWTNDRWTKFETVLDDVSLAELGFVEYSFISFEAKEDHIPGVCGLTNLGNTCFMNSALQCLSNIPKFTQNILSFGDEMNAPIIGAYSALIKTIWSGKHIVTTPSSLLLNIRENLPRFTRYRQQDAQEFMNYFLHLIHEELTSEKTLITDLFYGQIRSSVKCLGGCSSIETNEEVISFLPLPIGNDINKYDLLYLRSNGEQRLVSVRSCAKTIDTLIESFIEQHEPKLSSRRIKAVRIVDNRIREEYWSYTWLAHIIKHQLTFIEAPEITVEQRYIEFQFLDREIREPFRPPVFLVRPSYGCRYSDLSEQINQIQNHLCSITNAPTSACHFCWINDRHEIRDLNADISKDDDLLFMHQLRVEMDHEWIQKYQIRYNFERSISNASLDNLLTDFFREEPLNGDYYCSKCLGLKEAKQKADLALPLPPVLIIQLKRFTYDVYSDAKIDTYIDFPLRDLNLSKYVIQNAEKNTNVSALYDLVAVSNHTGTLISGHYTTYAKNDGNKTWYSFNDERTREISDEKDIVTKNAYILVYVKQSVQ
jgi:ubiquitin C-terminal hydrolase